MKRILVILLAISLTACGSKNEVKQEETNEIVEEIIQEEIVEEIIEETAEKEIEVSLMDDGVIIYDPGENKGYRYGPSFLVNEDGSIDAFFSRPGNNSSKWDYISYRHRDIEGNWSKEEIVLTPSNSGKDHYSVCDPGVIYFGGYYYLGYTGTDNPNGLANQVFVARSKNVNGPYYKWDGTSFSNNAPEPIIAYEGLDIYWGAGEVSFLVYNEDLCIYYTWWEDNECSTRISKADLVDDWPNTIRFKCIAFNHENGCDSADVIYVEDLKTFLAFAVENRMEENSAIAVYMSKDSKVFERICVVEDYFESFAHNMGVTKNLDGHVFSTDPIYVGYAYSKTKNWGGWKTKFQSIEIK